MMKAKQFLSKWGIHSFLLIVFFVLHNYLQYYGLVSAGTAFRVFAEIAGIVSLFFFCTMLLTRNMVRSLQITTLTSFIVLFYGVIKDFLSTTLKLQFLARYIVMLPLVIVIAILLYLIILKRKDFHKTNFFLNVLLLLFIFFDILTVWFNQSSFFLSRNMLVNKNIIRVNSISLPSDRPDVYFLLFDSYPGTGFLRDYLQYNNRDLDSALLNRGFYVAGNPRSNYNRTAFSLASELNFEYLNGINNDTKLRSSHYNKALFTVRNSVVAEVFQHLDYKIYNLSVFDFAEQEPVYKEDFLTLPEARVLLYNTLFERFRRDVGWQFVAGKYANGFFKKLNGANVQSGNLEKLKRRDYTAKIIDSIWKIPLEVINKPKFVYAHFYLPHPPYFYNENGEKNSLDSVLDEKTYFNKKQFLSYLKYSNKLMIKIVETIQKKPGKPAVIIIQSDHSSTDYEGCPDIPELCFENYTAFYFPDKQYRGVYETFSNINTFPVLFNKYFNTHIPMQKDTSTYLRY